MLSGQVRRLGFGAVLVAVVPSPSPSATPIASPAAPSSTTP